MKRAIQTSLFLGLLGLVSACDKSPDSLGTKPSFQPKPEDHLANQPAPFAGGEDNTFDHMNDLGAGQAKDPFEILKQRQEEGPPEIRSRLHSCQKLQNTALQNILVGFGVDLGATGNPPTAGQLLNGGKQSLGAANYDSRLGEAITWTSAGAAKLFDIFVQAAPEIIANIENAPQCQVGGVGTPLFDANGLCQEDAISCLIGRPAKIEHVAICDSIVESASDEETGKRIAVAALLSAAHSCE
jgi:hypothetical protein